MDCDEHKSPRLKRILSTFDLIGEKTPRIRGRRHEEESEISSEIWLEFDCSEECCSFP